MKKTKKEVVKYISKEAATYVVYGLVGVIPALVVLCGCWFTHWSFEVSESAAEMIRSMAYIGSCIMISAYINVTYGKKVTK